VAPSGAGEAAVDGAWVRQRAADVANLGDEVVRIAELARRGSEVEWESTAAASFRAGLDAELRRLLVVARAIDEAAAALRVHAGALETLAPVPLIGSLVQRVLS
jgi:hypothetical protein